MTTIDLDDTDKLISILMASISILGLLCRKWIFPLFGRVKSKILYWFSIPKKVEELRGFVSKLIGENIDGFSNMHHVLYVLKHKCDFLMSELDIPMYECDPSGACIWANSALCGLFGLESHEMIGLGWLNALHPDDIQAVSKKWSDSIKNIVPYKNRYRIIKENKIIFCETSAVPIYDENKNILSFLGKVGVINKETFLDK